MMHIIAVASVLAATASAFTGTVSVVRAVSPTYPTAAADAHLNADIEVIVRVDESGRVREARTKRAFPPFEASCIKAAFAWRFSPRRMPAGPEEVVLVFRFRIVDWDASEEDSGFVFEAPTMIEIRARMAKPKPIE